MPIIYTQKMSASYFVTQFVYIYSYNHYDLILQWTIYKLGVGLPVSLPFGDTAAELEAYQSNWADKISYVLTKAHAGENI